MRRTDPPPLAATPLPRCAGQLPLGCPLRRSSASRSPASAPPRCRWWWPTSAAKTSAAWRWPPSCAPTSSAAACSAPRRPAGRWTKAATSTWPTGAAAAPTPLVAGSVTRLADGRFDVRFRLWDAVEERAAAGPEQGRARGRPAPGRAPHRRRDPRKAHRRARRLRHPHRLRRARRPPLHAARHRRRRRRRAGGAGQPRAHHLAGLVARRQAAGLRVVRVAEGRRLGAGPDHRRAPHGGQLPRLQQRAGLVARRPAAGRDAVAGRPGAALHDARRRRHAACA